MKIIYWGLWIRAVKFYTSFNIFFSTLSLSLETPLYTIKLMLMLGGWVGVTSFWCLCMREEKKKGGSFFSTPATSYKYQFYGLDENEWA